MEANQPQSTDATTQYNKAMKLIPQVAIKAHERKCTKKNPCAVELPDGRVMNITGKSAGDLSKMLSKEHTKVCKSKKTKKRRNPSGDRKNIGFEKPAVFDPSIVSYMEKSLTDYLSQKGEERTLPSFEKLIPGTNKKNPLYGIIPHSSMTKVFDISAVSRKMSSDFSPSVYQGDKEFVKTFGKAIKKAQEKDRAKGRKEYSTKQLVDNYNNKDEKKIRGYVFNPGFFNHAQQSKIIETSKKDNVLLVDDCEGGDSDGANEERLKVLLEKNPKVKVVRTSEISKKLEKTWPGFSSLKKLWDDQNTDLKEIKAMA